MSRFRPLSVLLATLAACSGPDFAAPPAHRLAMVAVAPFQMVTPFRRSYDASLDTVEAAAQVEVRLFRRALIEELTRIEGILVDRWEEPDQSAFAPEAAGLLGGGLVTRPSVPRSRFRHPDAALIVTGSPLRSDGRVMVRLRVVAGSDGTMLEEVFVDLHGAGHGMEPAPALRTLTAAVARAARRPIPSLADNDALDLVHQVRSEHFDVVRFADRETMEAHWWKGNGWWKEDARPIFLREASSENAHPMAYAAAGAVVGAMAWMARSNPERWLDFHAEYGAPLGLPSDAEALRGRAEEARRRAAEHLPPGSFAERLLLTALAQGAPNGIDRLGTGPEALAALRPHIIEHPADQEVLVLVIQALGRSGCYGSLASLQQWMERPYWIPALIRLRLGDFADGSGVESLIGGEPDAAERKKRLARYLTLVPVRFRSEAPPELLSAESARSAPHFPDSPFMVEKDSIRDLRDRVRAGEAGARERFDELLERYRPQLARAEGAFGVDYERAALLAMAGDPEDAIDALEEVHRRGHLTLHSLENDPALDAVRDHTRVQALIEELYERLGAQRRLWARMKGEPPTRDNLRQIVDACLALQPATATPGS